MNPTPPEPSVILHWITTMTPDKLALVVPFIIAYVIVRNHRLSNEWIWWVCMAIGGGLFWALGPHATDRTTEQDIVTRVAIGMVLGFTAGLLALGLHSTAFQWLAKRWPALQFLVLLDPAQPAPPTRDAPSVPVVPSVPPDQPKP